MRTSILSIAGASLLVFAGCKTHEPSHFELGEAAEMRGDKVEALSQFQEAVRLEPAHKHAWRHIGYLKADKQGCKEYEKEVCDALLTFLLMETYEIGDVAGDREFGIPETPVEPHLARTMVRGLNKLIHQIEAIEGDSDICYREFLGDPSNGDLKQIALDSQQTVLDSNLGISPRAHYYMGEILRRSGDTAGAKSHYDTALAQSKELGRTNLRATASLSLVGGDLDEGWLAVSELDRRELYVEYIESCLQRNDLDRALKAALMARKHYADVTIWRQVAETNLLLDQTAGAADAIYVLEKWPCDDKEVAVFLRLCWAAESGTKIDGFAKKMDGMASSGTFDPTRLAAHVEASKADAAAKSAVRKAADKMAPKK
ncbi:MAG: hypothetical protein K8T20_10320 [Planctomycetes bacterium]|nr:hypothetical protein [Planctomycetota bacterium]